MESPKKIGPGKNLYSQSRKIVYNVYLFFEQNIRRDGRAVPTSLLLNLTALATGVSKRSIQEIVDELRKRIDLNTVMTGKQERQGPSTLAGSHTLVFEITSTKHPRKTDIPNRTGVYEFRLNDGTVPNLEKVLEVLKKNIDFKGSIVTLRKVLLKLGYNKQREKGIRKHMKPLEKNQIRFKRVAYISHLQRYRLQGTPIVYIAETNFRSMPIRAESSEEIEEGKTPKANCIVVMSACTEHGFVPNSLLMFKSHSKTGDYQSSINANSYQKWIKETLLPNLKPESVLVINNEEYQNVPVDPIPTHNSEKADMLAWLIKHNISYPIIHTKPILYALIKEHKSQYTEYVVDKFLKEYGHNVLRLPPQHPELNVLEVLFGIVKENLAFHKFSDDLDLFQTFIEDELESITKDVFDEVSKTVKECETNYMELEKLLDLTNDDFITKSSESESTDQSSDDDKGLNDDCWF